MENVKRCQTIKKKNLTEEKYQLFFKKSENFTEEKKFNQKSVTEPDRGRTEILVSNIELCVGLVKIQQ